MNKLVLTITLLLIFTGSLFAQLRIGVVDTDVILQEHPQLLQGAEAQLANEVKQWEVARKPWEADMERLQADIIQRDGELKKGKMLSESKRNLLQRQLDSLQADFQQRFQMQMAQDQERLQMRRAELLNEVFSSVREIVKEVGEAEDYDLIIDSAGAVIYARDPEDVTDSVLRSLQDR